LLSIAVCVAVEIGRLTTSSSFVVQASLVSLNSILSQLAIVQFGIQSGKITSLIVFKLVFKLLV
jgi:hypothetical protein